jgi:glutaconate CoA-transferase subunit A
VTRLTTLSAAIERLVNDGDTVAMEGFTHLIPHAAGHEVIRQAKRDLHLIRMTPDIIYDQLIGMGCASHLTFSWGGNPGVGSLRRFRDSVENGWPHKLTYTEHAHAAMAAAYQAGASNLPFAILRGYAAVDQPDHNDDIAWVDCPFTGEKLAAVKAHRPNVTIIHAQQADREGNVQLWGIVGVQKEAALAADRVIVTVEEVVDTLTPKPGGVVLPAWILDAVCEVPHGAHPSYAHGYYDRDNDFYLGWDDISKDRETFRKWIETHVLGTENFAEYLESAGVEVTQ